MDYQSGTGCKINKRIRLNIIDLIIYFCGFYDYPQGLTHISFTPNYFEKLLSILVNK